jgi:hypothetical protein
MYGSAGKWSLTLGAENMLATGSFRPKFLKLTDLEKAEAVLRRHASFDPLYRNSLGF